MKGMIKFIFYASLLPFFFAFVQEAVAFLRYYLDMILSSWFFAGFVTYCLSYILFLKKHLEFLETFEHELAHAITSLLFFNKVKLFGAASDGTGVVWASRRMNAMILLAPYFLPVFTLPMIFTKPYLSFSYQPALDFAIGVTLGFHFIGLIKEFKAHQTDIQKVGMTLSYLLVIFFNAFFLVLIISMVFADSSFFLDYVRRSLLHGILLYEKITAAALSSLPV